VKVHFDENCGNSPRNLFLKNFTVALTKGDKKYVEKNITEVVKWDYIGKEIIAGKDNFLKELTKSKLIKPKTLKIDSVISHGNTGAVSGFMESKNESNHAFCHLFRLNGFTHKAIVKEISSFVIKIKI
jgi:hypothetical protein